MANVNLVRSEKTKGILRFEKWTVVLTCNFIAVQFALFFFTLACNDNVCFSLVLKTKDVVRFENWF
jgi:hypothetical protein